MIGLGLLQQDQFLFEHVVLLDVFLLIAEVLLALLHARLFLYVDVLRQHVSDLQTLVLSVQKGFA